MESPRSGRLGEGSNDRGARSPRSHLPLPEVAYEVYCVEGEQGRGGIGLVLRAHDRRLDRTVALKRLQSCDAEARVRFEREMRITARLQHPGVVPVYEAGRFPSGEPFYAMTLVEGSSLRELIETRPALRERLLLVPNVLATAEAVAFAHSRRILHRDLKPSNVIVGAFGETVVIDWGLAKDLDEDDASPDRPASPHRPGSVLGTPAYMAPEQARGEPVDERTDVYALGAIVYHLLTGAPPYAPAASSEIVDHVVQGPPPPLQELAPEAPPELVAIACKAMAREPAARYASAKHFAEDLRRLQAGGLVGAHTYTGWQLLLRWLRRYRLAVAVAVPALVVLLGIGVVAIQRIVHERNLAASQRTRADVARGEAQWALTQAQRERNQLVLVQARSFLENDPTAAVAWLKKYPLAGDDWNEARNIAADAASRQVAAHVLRGHDMRLHRAVFAPDGHTLASIGADRRLVLWDAASGKQLLVVDAIAEQGELAFDGSSRRFAYTGGDRTVVLVDRASGGQTRLDTASGTIRSVSLSSDGAWLAAAGDASVLLWRLADGAAFVLDGHRGPVHRVQFAPGGAAFASCGADRRLLLWDAATRSSDELGSCDASVDPGFSFSADGSTLAFGQLDGRVQIVRLRDRRRQSLAAGDEPAHVLALSSDGERLAIGGSHGTTTIWSTATASRLGELAQEGAVYSVEFSPGGDLVLTAGERGDAHLFAWELGTEWRLRGHKGFVAEAHFAGDGTLALTAGEDGAVRLWRVPTDRPVALVGHEKPTYHPVWLPELGAVASEGADGTVRVWDLATRAARVLRGHLDVVYSLARAPAGAALASASWDGTIRVWDLRTGAQVVLDGHGGIVRDLAYLPGGAIVSAGADGTVRLWNPGARASTELARHDGEAYRVAISPAGTRVASGGTDGAVRVIDLHTRAVQVLRAHEDTVYRLAFSPDGTQLVSGGWDGRLVLWDLTRSTKRELHRHGDRVSDVAFSPDGAWIASASRDGTVYYHHAPSDAGSTYRGHTSPVIALAFAPASDRLATGGGDGSVRMLELATARACVLRGHAQQVAGIAFEPDGARVATAGFDGVVLVRNSTCDRLIEVEPRLVQSQLQGLTSAEVLASGATLTRTTIATHSR